MNRSQQENKETEDFALNQTDKKAWVSPKLLSFGNVRDLTKQVNKPDNAIETGFGPQDSGPPNLS